MCKSLLLLFCISVLPFRMYAEQPPLKLWYNQPATVWMTSALPIGNGELGGMFFGGVQQERIQFNEKTLWTGHTSSRGAYQNFGDLYLDFSGHASYTDYRRELSLDRAIGTVSYKIGEVQYVREYFASNPDSALIMRISTPGSEGKLTFSVTLKDAHPGTTTVTGNTITMKGKLDILSYEAQVRVLNEGGTLVADNNKISITDANAVTILLTGATDFDINSNTYVHGTAGLHRRISTRIDEVAAKDYADLRIAHLNDYQPKFNRVKLDFGVTMPEIPTDMLVRSYRDNMYLDILYFQYGRYLMLGSSRGMNLPNNLQGLWNDSNNPAWQCDIHSNINIQMNYWPAEVTNLSECHLPFLNYIVAEAQRENGSWQKVARKEGITKGWTINTQSNIFGYTDWNINRPANGWYCTHLWNHFAYANDTTYLKETAFPVMKSACEYWFQRLKEVDGKLIAPNEWSPEQGPWEDGVSYAQQLVWELFDQTLKAAELVEPDGTFKTELAGKFKKLDNGLVIGSWGQIREWKITNDVQGNNHRHLSHLIALFPGNQISYHKDKAYADAAKVTLNSRGDGGTGWSRAWKILCWARLSDGDHAYRLLKQALHLTEVTTVTMDDNAGGVYENLLDAHPSFQIDGNFGATAGIAEMLLQSNCGFIQILPALPWVWPNGNFEGLKGQGNFTIDLSWKNSLPVECKVYSGSGTPCKLYYPGIRVAAVKDQQGNVVNFATEENMISFPTVKDGQYTVSFAGVLPSESEITPSIQVNDGEKQQISTIVLNEGDKLVIVPEITTSGGVWKWTGPSGFSSLRKELSFDKVKFAQSGTYTVTYTVNNQVSSYAFSVIVVNKILESKNTLQAGDYYIKKKGTNLYWTNTQVAPSGTNPGGKPALCTLGSVSNELAQVWILSLDKGYYKMVNKADGRYVNEKGDFGKNTYYQDWNTFNIYNDEELNCAIQITQKSATQEKGAFLWHWNANNEISYSTWTTVDPSQDLVFTFVPYMPTGMINPESENLEIWVTDHQLNVRSEGDFQLLIYNASGHLIKNTKNTIQTATLLLPGLYVVKVIKGNEERTKTVFID